MKKFSLQGLILAFLTVLLSLGFSQIFWWDDESGGSEGEAPKHAERIHKYRMEIEKDIEAIDSKITDLTAQVSSLSQERQELSQILENLGGKTQSEKNFWSDIDEVASTEGDLLSSGFHRFMERSKFAKGPDFVKIQTTQKERSLTFDGDRLIETIEKDGQTRERITVESSEIFYGMNLLMGGLEQLKEVVIVDNGASKEKIKRWVAFYSHFTAGRNVPMIVKKEKLASGPSLKVKLKYATEPTTKQAREKRQTNMASNDR